MRLTCPNCGAQYEVDDGVIPEGGRDVQCSACGHGWFQLAAARTPELTPPPPLATPRRVSRPAPPPPVAESIAPPEEADTPEIAEAPVAQEEEAPEPLTAAPITAAPRRTLDDAVLNVLREEAEREARVREQEKPPAPAEPEPAPAVAESTPPPAPIPVQEAPLSGDVEDTGPLEYENARRHLLPDIEEINSTLRATSERRRAEPEQEDPRLRDARRRGFRLGFGLALLVLVGLISVYSFAGRISQSLPQAAPYVAGYVKTVNDGRIWLDQVTRDAASSLSGNDGE